MKQTDVHPPRPSLRTEQIAGGDQLGRIGRLMDLHGVLQSSMVQLTGGAFLTGLLLTLGARELVIGIAASLPLAAKLSQLVVSWRIERNGAWRGACIRGALVGRLPLLLIGLVPLLVDAGSAGVWVLMGLLAISALGGAVWEIGFLTWSAELVPASKRGVFWGRRTRVAELAGIIVAVGASFWLESWRRGHPGEVEGYVLLFAVGALLGSIGILTLPRLPNPERVTEREPPKSLWATLLRPARDPNFRNLLLFVGIWGFAVGMVGPFTAVFMLAELDLSFVTVTLMLAIPTIVIALTQARWGKLVDHFGSRPVIRVASYIIVAATGAWALASPERTWPIYGVQVLMGIGWSAYNIAINALVLKLAPPASRSSYVASVGALFAVTQSISPILVGGVIALLRGGGVPSLEIYWLLFAASMVVRGLATPILGRLAEEGGAPVGHMIRVIGRFRAMGASPGTEMIFDYAYTHMARIAEFITGEEPRRLPRLLPTRSRVRRRRPGTRSSGGGDGS